MLAAFSGSCGSGPAQQPGPGGQDGGGRLHLRPAPLARFRLQPGVRRVSRLQARRRSAPRRLERVRAHRAHVSQALPRRNQLPGERAAGHQRLDEIRLEGNAEAGVRQVSGGLGAVSGAFAARRRGADRVRRRGAPLRAAVHAAGPVAPAAARDRGSASWASAPTLRARSRT